MFFGWRWACASANGSCKTIIRSVFHYSSCHLAIPSGTYCVHPSRPSVSRQLMRLWILNCSSLKDDSVRYQILSHPSIQDYTLHVSVTSAVWRPSSSPSPKINIGLFTQTRMRRLMIKVLLIQNKESIYNFRII